MNNIRPMGWVIIVLNAYFFINFFVSLEPNESDTVIGFSFMFLIFWLAILNTFLYVIYRVTGSKQRQCPGCGNRVKKGLTVCPTCEFNFLKNTKEI